MIKSQFVFINQWTTELVIGGVNTGFSFLHVDLTQNECPHCGGTQVGMAFIFLGLGFAFTIASEKGEVRSREAPKYPKDLTHPVVKFWRFIAPPSMLYAEMIKTNITFDQQNFEFYRNFLNHPTKNKYLILEGRYNTDLLKIAAKIETWGVFGFDSPNKDVLPGDSNF